MLRRVVTVLVATTLAVPISGCTSGIRLSVDAAPSAATQPEQPQRCVKDEVELQLADGSLLRAKITAVEDETVAVLPHPYWPPSSVRLPVQDIHVVKVLRSRRNVPVYGSACLGTTFAACGLLLVASAECKSDAGLAFAVAPVAGGTAGLLGLAFGASSDRRVRRTYRFLKLPLAKRTEILRVLALPCPPAAK